LERKRRSCIGQDPNMLFSSYILMIQRPRNDWKYQSVWNEP
jgi:hypothetical protein